jgi:uncharacterized protein YceH (UPF0502 family)
MHLLSGDTEAGEPPAESSLAAATGSAESSRLAHLEAEVADLRKEISDLQQQFAAFRKQFE